MLFLAFVLLALLKDVRADENNCQEPIHFRHFTMKDMVMPFGKGYLEEFCNILKGYYNYMDQASNVSFEIPVCNPLLLNLYHRREFLHGLCSESMPYSYKKVYGKYEACYRQAINFLNECEASAELMKVKFIHVPRSWTSEDEIWNCTKHLEKLFCLVSDIKRVCHDHNGANWFYMHMAFMMQLPSLFCPPELQPEVYHLIKDNRDTFLERKFGQYRT